MPTYQYRCTKCEDEFEVVQSFTDDPVTECPKCGGVVRKQFSSVGVVFKGAGFYKTDSRKKTETKPADPKPAATPKP
jgi:putative FmdB family regulatory protein